MAGNRGGWGFCGGDFRPVLLRAGEEISGISRRNLIRFLCIMFSQVKWEGYRFSGPFFFGESKFRVWLGYRGRPLEEKARGRQEDR